MADEKTHATALRPPSKVKVDAATKASAEEIKVKLDAGVPDGEFISDGNTYNSDDAAKKQRSAIVRYLTSTHGASLRTRTWEVTKGKWVFGVRPK